MSRLLLGAAAVLLTTAASQPPPAPIRIDQAGFETRGPKTGVLPSSQATPLAWTLTDARGKTVASGQTKPVGPDAASGENVHRIDFGTFRTPGTGYRLHVGTNASHAFAIADRPFAPIATAAMAFFYQQRSGVPILPAYVEREDLARPAGHAPDIATCFAGRDQKGVKWPGCSYRIDATGGCTMPATTANTSSTAASRPGRFSTCTSALPNSGTPTPSPMVALRCPSAPTASTTC